MKLVQAIEMIQDAVFANGAALVDVSEGEQFRVMHLAGTPRANEVTAIAAAALVSDNRARILEEVPEGIEHFSLLGGKYVAPEPEETPVDGDSEGPVEVAPDAEDEGAGKPPAE